jgi:hypothetical protein
VLFLNKRSLLSLFPSRTLLGYRSADQDLGEDDDDGYDLCDTALAKDLFAFLVASVILVAAMGGNHYVNTSGQHHATKIISLVFPPWRSLCADDAVASQQLSDTL